MASLTHTFYKKAKNGKIQQWSITRTGDSFRTSEGYVGGAITTSEPTVCLPKNVGRANETSGAEQAEKELHAKITKQREKGYTSDIEEVDQAAKKIDPMLAHKWKDHESYIKSLPLVASQPKLDGIRCIATPKGLFTRNGKPILSCPHIFAEVSIIFQNNVQNDFYFDGEIYNHELKADFNKITSIVRKQKPTPEDFAESFKLAQYHIYDMQMNDPNDQRSFERRSQIISVLLKKGVLEYGNKSLHAVSTNFYPVTIELEVLEFDKWLDALNGHYIEQGYEGQMIRNAGSLYQAGRTKDLLKRKQFEDAEFVIRDIEEGVGNRSGMMGRIKFDGFDSNARGTHEYWRELLKNKKKYIGKMATVRYQNLTPDGVPRFPVMIGIRDYE